MSTHTDRYGSFYNPFAKGNIVEHSTYFPNALSFVHVDSPPPYESNWNPLRVVYADKTEPTDSGDSLQYNASTDLTITGQGTVIASCTAPQRLLFSLRTADAQTHALYLDVTTHSVRISYGRAGPSGSMGFLPPDSVVIEGKPVKKDRSEPTYLRRTTGRYWLSVDHKNGILRFGRDYTNLTMALYEAHLKQRVDRGVLQWKDENHAFIDKLDSVSVQQWGGDLNADPLRIVYQPLPIVEKLPPIIAPSELITLDELSKASATVPANLSPECQRLYANIAGPNIQLDTPEFPDFSQAIERSVNTKGLLCQRLLEEKADKFGKKDHKSTYLRITFGADLGESPGSPYVLEIWPGMHHSPIHHHANSHAVIKVLHGRIKAYYFASLQDVRQIGPPLNLEKGDITWIDPQNYQVHQLSNENQDLSVCCTIQCYSYGKADTRHYEVFDYIQTPGKEIIEHFEPNSDKRFDEFKEAIRAEWETRWTSQDS